MKICHIHPYTSPPNPLMALGGALVLESLVRGQKKLGHEVCLKINQDSTSAPATIVSEIPDDVDILHFHTWNTDSLQDYSKYGKPWVATIGGVDVSNPPEWYESVLKSKGNIIAVSKFIQGKIKCNGYVWNCSDADQFTFSEQKSDYFLFLGGTDWAENKGIFSTILYAKKLKFKLILAGGGRDQRVIDQIKSLCDDKIKYVGPVDGETKKKLLSEAKAVILLTRLPEACAVVLSEALLSGTPVIGSPNGSMPEIVTSDVGFICKNDSDFTKAILQIGKVNPNVCRQYALDHLSSLVCAKQYLHYYENMLKYNNISGD